MTFDESVTPEPTEKKLKIKNQNNLEQLKGKELSSICKITVEQQDMFYLNCSDSSHGEQQPQYKVLIKKDAFLFQR